MTGATPVLHRVVLDADGDPAHEGCAGPPGAPGVRGRGDRLGLAIGAALVAALPLVADPAGWYVHLPARWLVLVLATTAMVAAGVASTRPRGSVPGGRAWVALVALAVVSAAASSAPGVALWGAGDRSFGAATWLLHGALAWAGWATVRHRRDLVVLARAMVVGVLAVAMVTAAQRVGWDVPAGAASTTRPGGPLGNANFLGAYCVLAAPVAAGLLLDRSQRTGWRVLGAVAGLAALGCAVLSGSRAAWLCLLLGAAAMAAVALRAAGPADRRARRRVVGGLLVAGAFAVVLGAALGAGDRLDDLTGGTARGRVDTWGVAIRVLGERPALGWGPEGFAEGATGSIDDAWEQRYGRRLTPDRAHLGLLDVATTLGLAGLAAHLAVLAGTARGVRRALRAAAPPAGPDPALCGVAVGLGAYLLHQQSLFQLFDVDALAWVLAGGLCALGRGAHHGPHRPAPTGPAVPGSGARRRSATLACVLAVGVLLAGAGVRAVVADRHARGAADALGAGDAEHALAEARASLERSPQALPALLAADAALSAGSDEALREGLGLVRRTAAATFDDGRLTLAEARLLRHLGNDGLAEAIELVESLVRHDGSRGEAWLLLGDLHAAAGDDAEAVTSWERAAHLSPRRTAPLERLAPAYEAAGQDRAALDAIRRIEELRGPGAGPLSIDLALLRARLEVRLGG